MKQKNTRKLINAHQFFLDIEFVEIINRKVIINK